MASDQADNPNLDAATQEVKMENSESREGDAGHIEEVAKRSDVDPDQPDLAQVSSSETRH